MAVFLKYKCAKQLFQSLYDLALQEKFLKFWNHLIMRRLMSGIFHQCFRKCCPRVLRMEMTRGVRLQDKEKNKRRNGGGPTALVGPDFNLRSGGREKSKNVVISIQTSVRKTHQKRVYDILLGIFLVVASRRSTLKKQSLKIVQILV